MYLSAALLGLLLATPAAAQAPFDPPGLDRATAAKDFHVDGLMGIDGVVGVGVGLTARGQAAIVIMTEDRGVAGLPRSLDGVPVRVKVTGKIHAVPKPTCPGHPSCKDDPPPEEDPPADVDSTSRLDRPVPIGVSTGNGSGASCSSGTIGFRVTDTAGKVYAMSNNHIYALSNDLDAEDGVPLTHPDADDIAALDDPAVQPGLFDSNCDGTGNRIGMLHSYVPFDLTSCSNGGVNYVDVSIALLDTPGGEPTVGTSTPPDGYGTPSSATVPVTNALVGLNVQKYGRTTGLTRGMVTMIDVDVNVGYSKGTGCFRDQIVVESFKGPFIKGGDSGSGLVTDDPNAYPVATPVGLLYAGNMSGKLAIASPIDWVLDALEDNPPAGPALEGPKLVGADIDDTPPSP